ncbi:MAG: hypothetical protein PHV39_02590 [Methanomicrobium sp.]|nr:hypothetical protein [Methanomicrobium sp.]
MGNFLKAFSSGLSGIVKTVSGGGSSAVKVATTNAEIAAKTANAAGAAAEEAAKVISKTGKTTAAQAKVLEAAVTAQKEATAATSALSAVKANTLTSRTISGLTNTLTSKTVIGSGILGGTVLIAANLLGSGSTADNIPGDTTATAPTAEDIITNPYTTDPAATDDFDWQAWYDSLFGGADDTAGDVLGNFSDIPYVGDVVEEAKAAGLSLPLLIVVILIVLVIASFILGKYKPKSAPRKQHRRKSAA